MLLKLNYLLCGMVFTASAFCNANDDITIFEHSSSDLKGNTAEVQESNNYFMPEAVNTVPIVSGLKTSKLFRIGAARSHIVKDGDLVSIGETPLIINNGNALIEGSNISVQRSAYLKGWMSSGYSEFKENEVVIEGLISMKGNYGINLITDLEKERHTRICIKNIKPNWNNNQDWDFYVYADGVKIEYSIHNNSCVDVEAKQVAILLKSWPPVGAFEIIGQYQVFF
ncbi:hypothetical protein LH51_15085 [Nitrincola sp. A-D6]|uniref:hypothetical protein n=1 Tax=Nitrincola sp. A-D6 TaxID=1545442 RepID=UPI00051FB623|nr:hypothetical protein [Nitrincola sp. A-D6]KGK41398.1 hypothetical protein LH51_15085 [Nitrincola sp. A-D6]